MMPVKKILIKLNGLHYRQEYLCFAKESYTQPLHAYLVNDGCIIKDITYQHLFVGYSPLIFAFPKNAVIELTETIRLMFSHKVLHENDIFSEKDALAFINMNLVKEQVAGNNNISYFEGTHGEHHFLSMFHQFINSIYNRSYNKRPGNVFLPDNLYKQVQIAYAIPRIISLIAVSNNNLYNLFPTDLHGQVDEEHYIISLRIGGKACEQAEATGKLLISQMNCKAYKTVYALGKNHMQELSPKDNFPFSHSLSEKFQLLLPQDVISYKELTLINSFPHGIHKLLLFKIVWRQQIEPETATLAHIHNAYATWRYKNKFPGNYLLR